MLAVEDDEHDWETLSEAAEDTLGVTWMGVEGVVPTPTRHGEPAPGPGQVTGRGDLWGRHVP